VTLGLFDPAFLGGLAAGGGGYDTDAQAYITAVEAADGQSLEVGVKDAINAFFVGCKADGVFSALKASCILAGARTLSGALVPLVSTMPAPTNGGGNFQAGDYNRKTGLVGNGSTTYLNSNRNNNDDPQNSNHNAVYATTVGTALAIHGGILGTAGSNQIGLSARKSRNNNAILGIDMENGFAGINRANGVDFTYRTGGVNTVALQTSETPSNGNVVIGAGLTSPTTATGYGTHRIAFYSIGESLDLALLDARVSTLMSDLAAAIP